MRIKYKQDWTRKAIFKTKEEAQDFVHELINQEGIIHFTYTVSQIKAGFVVYRRA